MLNFLKELIVGNMLTIDDKDVVDFTGVEDYNVVEIKLYSQEEGEILILDLENGFYLMSHTFRGNPKYYMYELNATGTQDNIEDDGFRLVFRDDPLLPTKIYAGRNDREVPYKLSLGPIYSLNVEQDTNPPEYGYGDLVVCEYRSKIKSLPKILIVKNDTNFDLYQGFQINKSNIIV